ncbi:MAG: four-helix bundle copper-binding protein [Bacteroidota bacterium]|nr:four-helix bundle copper-binding protein [Bacteroidota bacterium]
MEFNANRNLVEMINKCASECDYCASACLNEENVKHLAKCIKMNLLCADICRTTAIFIARETEHAEHIIKECTEICELCAKECAKHETEHCKKCSEVCSNCADQCKKVEMASH